MNLEYIVSKSAKPWHHKIFHQMMWRYLSAPLVWFFLKIRLKPNQITFISLMSKTISIIFYLLFWKIPAVIMYEFSILCDCADGAVARIRNLSSTKGKLFDGIGDTVAQHIFFMILPIALFLKYKNLNILIIGFVLYALVSTREIICAYGYIELKNKGLLKEGYDADLVIVDLDKRQAVRSEDLLTKCKWSPFEGKILKGWPVTTIVNGNVVYDNGQINDIKAKEVRYAG